MNRFPSLFALSTLFLVLAVGAVTFSLSQPDNAAGGTPIVVNSTGDQAADDGECTLREAILAANTDTASGVSAGECVASAGQDTINFDIDTGCEPVSGVCTITPDTDLPAISDLTDILGYTQDGAVPATANAPAELKIVIDGTNTSGTTNEPGLITVGALGGTTEGSSVSGLVLINSPVRGIHIQFEGDVSIHGNHIGVDVSGAVAAPNFDGVATGPTVANTIGGVTPADRNVISGNTRYGVSVGGNNTLVIGNYIGTDASGTQAIPNALGVNVNGAEFVEVGQSSPGTGNVISGNAGNGVRFTGAETTSHNVKRNLIGTQADGVSPLPNGVAGVHADLGTSDILVGSSTAGEANVIAFNAYGVRVTNASFDVRIIANSIYSNTIAGISNESGGNAELAPPVVAAAGSASGTACPNCDVEVFSDDDDQGRIFEGAVTADGTGNWDFPGAVTGPFITATARDADGNTSEFSSPFELVTETPTPTPSASPTPTTTPDGSPTPTTTPTPTGQSPTPTATGQSPTPTATPTPTPGPGGPWLHGDINCSGAVDPVDSLGVLRYDAGLTVNKDDPDCPDAGELVQAAAAAIAAVPQSETVIWGDVDCDSAVNPVDSLKILRYDAGLSVSQMPGCPLIGSEVGPVQ